MGLKIFTLMGLFLQLFILLLGSLLLPSESLAQQEFEDFYQEDFPDNNYEVLAQRNEDLQVYGVKLIHQNNEVVMNNGIVSVTLAAPSGDVTSVTYRGGDNLLETKNEGSNRGYWDVVWGYKKGVRQGVMDKLAGTEYKVIMQTEDQTEISFTRKWELGNDKVPLNVDKRFVMLRDSPGFYTYTVLERLKGWPAFGIGEGRFVFKLENNKFHYMAVSDEMQRIMPMPEDRVKGHVLDYPEAVLLTNPSFSNLTGEVDDKYFYSVENKDNKVHGWVSNDHVPVGFWIITPTNEFRTGGPFKQDLTSHAGPTSLSMFISSHYTGRNLSLHFEVDEYWKKVFGPVFIYLNSDHRAMSSPSLLWGDAKQRMEKEVASWPYSFPLSRDFLKSNQRGVVTGQLLVHEKLIDKHVVPAASAYVGLAPPGAVGSWQIECKGYQFWTQTDRDGNFLIKNVLPGEYNLYASVPGRLGDYKHDSNITIAPGTTITIRNAVFEPPRSGPTLWEIGIPDRTAAEFFIPDSDRIFKSHTNREPAEKFRTYGLWKRYSDLYPRNDLVYTVGTSNYKKDWFFAHVNRQVGQKKFAAATWQIVFDLKSVSKIGNYTLQLALASANGAELQVRINNPESPAVLTTGVIGQDNAVARHGIHGLYHLYSIGIECNRLVTGNNTIFLTQAKAKWAFSEVMYDYIRLEGPMARFN